MNMHDTLALASWIKGRASLADVERADSVGIVGNVRFTGQAVRAFRLLWTWGAPRYGGSAGIRQERFYDKCGAEALRRRHARAQKLAARIVAS